MNNGSEWKQIKEIFSAALDLAPEKRGEFVLMACGRNESLHQEVESWLASYAESDDFIETPAFEIDRIFTNGSDNGHKRFGNYRIIKEIGYGGMGAVFLAERDDGEFSQRVAIKIIRQAIAESEIINRFRRERQILATLNHPNIARLLDGGISDDGLPFLAMEFVDGDSITKFADRENLNVEDQLNLFLKVCVAVAYAHRNLIVHRDLKPSNILVTKDGEPKLLDFGLAKLLDENLTSEKTQTQTAFRALTPAYASPEQLKNEPITTASDIYSLGVVLYELLSEERPFYFEGNSLDEIIRTVTMLEPPPPSANPRSAIRNPQLKGDLDNIVLMALRKEPERRYQSVEAFANDIERFLNGLPVAARGSGLIYRASKFIKRNKVGVLAASLIFFSLIGGIIATTRQARIAQNEKENAQTEAIKSKKITKFMEKVFNYANPSWYAEGNKLKGRAQLSEVLDDLSTNIETEFPGELDIQAELHHKYAEIYIAKGSNERGLFHAQRALELRRLVFGPKHPEVAKDLYYLSAAKLSTKRLNASLRLADQAIEMFREFDMENPNFPYLLEDQSRSYANFLSDFGTAEKYMTEALEIFRRKDGENHFNTVRQYLNLGVLFAKRGEIVKAEDYFSEGERRVNPAPDENLRQILLEYRALFEQAKGNHSAAEQLLEDFLTESKQNDEESPLAYKVRELLRRFYGENKSYEKFVESLKHEVKIEESRPFLNKDMIGKYKADIAVILFRLKKNDEAMTYFAQSYQTYKVVSPDFAEMFTFEQHIGECLFHLKRYEEAEPLLQKAVEFNAENTPPILHSPELFEMLDKTKTFLAAQTRVSVILNSEEDRPENAY